jgi:DNA-binding IclR family transcriptional regulator
MASMFATEIAVLRALLRFSRRRAPATVADLLAGVGGDPRVLHHALASLARQQLVLRNGDSARLSLSGFAVAVAAAATARRAKAVARPRVPAMARRRRAA